VRIGVCPGSFDPVTNGHVDIFERGSRLVDKLIIAVSSNPNKNSLFTMEERVAMIRNSVKHIPNVEIDCTGGLLNEYVKSKNATIIIRGLRALSDFEYDKKYRELVDLEVEHPELVQADSPTHRVGGLVLDSFEK